MKSTARKNLEKIKEDFNVEIRFFKKFGTGFVKGIKFI